MQELLKRVESLNHLRAFEAAARHASFTRAASELNVSQPAISQSIRRLEAALGVSLFRRGHRTISLTDAGALLFHDVSEGFGRILSTVRHLARLAETRHVTLSVSTAFANYWMVPRLQAFHDAHPDIDLRLQTTDKDLDLAQERISLGVRRGDGQWRGYRSARIAAEDLRAVAGPVFAAGLSEDMTLEQLTHERLIHLEEPHRPRPTWRDWFASQGLAFRDTGAGLRLNDYALVLQAAMAGEGICLGWRHVTAGLIRQGLLAQVGPWCWNSDHGFYLVWSDESPLTPQAATVRDWIVATAGVPELPNAATA